MKVVFHEEFYSVYTSDPAAAAGRMEAVVEEVSQYVEMVAPGPASEEDISAVHTARHVERVRSRGLYDIAALAAGGAIKAAILGMEEPAFGLIRPPGHHASADSCWGFCYFNNMAVAVELLKRKGLVDRAYILDIDLHFGDGTANILGRRPDVTVHNVSAFTREEYLSEVAEEMTACQADVIGVSAGFDNHVEDWGGLLHTSDYRRIGGLVRDAAARNRGGCFAILEGGYNHQVLGRNVLALIQGMEEGPGES